jgi:hypothetical protein
LKKYNLYILLVLISFLSLEIFSAEKNLIKKKYIEKDLELFLPKGTKLKDVKWLKVPSMSYKKVMDMVPDPETASKIAEVIWFNDYDSTITQYKPFKVRLLKNGIWEVTLQSIHENMEWVPYLYISKKDSRIIKRGYK